MHIFHMWNEDETKLIIFRGYSFDYSKVTINTTITNQYDPNFSISKIFTDDEIYRYVETNNLFTETQLEFMRLCCV